MKEIIINGIRIMVLYVPDDSYNFGKQELIDGWFELFYEMLNKPDFVYLRVKGDFKIISTLKDISETDCEILVEKVILKNLIFYKDYNLIEKAKIHPSEFARVLPTAKESLISKLKSEGFDTNKNLFLIEIESMK